jgi:GNAT superfamily N-acetyltransferase
VHILPHDPTTDCRATWARFHAYRRARDVEARPGDPEISDEAFEQQDRAQSPHHAHKRWLAVDGNRVVGSLYVTMTLPGNPTHAENARFLFAGMSVLTPWRRRGVGTRLIARLHRVMHEEERSIANVGTQEPDGHAFLRHFGAAEKLRMIENRLRMDTVDWRAFADLKDAVVAANPELTLETWRGRVPLEVIEPLLPAFSRLHEDVPFGDLDHGATRLDIDHVREAYRQLDRFGGAHHLVMFRAPGGDVAGVAEVWWNASMETRGYHSFTGVHRDWRGRKLAQALKIAVLEQVRAEHPAVSVMCTVNAAQNAPMLAVNAKLGFKPHHTHCAYQIDRDRLGAWTAGRMAA